MNSYFNIGDLIINIKDDKKTIKYCEKLPVIPQNLGTCWFNAILMAMIYSDGLSQYIYEKAIENNWQDDDNGAFKTLMLLFMNYVRAIKNGKLDYIDKLRKFLKKYKTELILLDFLTYYHKDLLKKYELIIKKGYHELYLSYILDKLGLNCSLILFGNDKFYYNGKIGFDELSITYIPNDTINEKPDILLFKKITVFKENDFKEINIDNLKNFGEEIIEFNGFQYKLDCILLRDEDLIHIITGLTCNGSKYVYNGWWKYRGSPCNLMPFKWTIDTTNFCLNQMDCNLEKDLKDTDLCFNFKNNDKLMVYVKIKQDKSETGEIKHIKKINQIKISPYINEFNEDEIKNLLLEIYKKTLQITEIKELKGLLIQALMKKNTTKDELKGIIKLVNEKDEDNIKEELKKIYDINSLSFMDNLSHII